MKMQEIMAIPHQTEQSIVAQIVNFSDASNLPVLRHAVWAVSSALTATFSRNVDFYHKAHVNYTAALKGLSEAVGRAERRKMEIRHENGVVEVVRPPVSFEMIAVAAVFVWYEGAMSTAAVAFIHHVGGAGRMLLTRRPAEFTTDFGFAIFRSVRYMVSLYDNIMVHTTGLATQEWMTAPYTGRHKSHMDQVADFMILAPCVLKWVSDACVHGLPIPRSPQADKKLKDIAILEFELDKWWLKFQYEVTQKHGWVYTKIESDSIDAEGKYVPMTLDYYSHQVAECIAHYEMCRLVLSISKAAFARGSDYRACRAESEAHAAGILAILPWLEPRSTTYNAREFFGMLGALITAIVASPSKAQREYGTYILYKWGPPGGLDGDARDGPTEKWAKLKTIWEREDTESLVRITEVPIRQA